MRTATLQNYDMKDYDVLVLPSGSYSSATMRCGG